MENENINTTDIIKEDIQKNIKEALASSTTKTPLDEQQNINSNSDEIKVLVVEDDEIERISLKSALETENLVVEVAKDGLSAEDIVKTKYFDIAVVDYKLPDIDGLNLIKRLKSSLPDMMFLIITAHTSVEIAVESLKMGAYDYITKPLNIPSLVHNIRKMKQYKESLFNSKKKLVEIVTKNEMKYLFKDENVSIITTPNSNMLLDKKDRGSFFKTIKNFFKTIRKFYWG